MKVEAKVHFLFVSHLDVSIVHVYGRPSKVYMIFVAQETFQNFLWISTAIQPFSTLIISQE